MDREWSKLRSKMAYKNAWCTRRAIHGFQGINGKMAISAYRNGTATQEQLQLLKDGHWQAP